MQSLRSEMRQVSTRARTVGQFPAFDDAFAHAQFYWNDDLVPTLKHYEASNDGLPAFQNQSAIKEKGNR